MGESVTPCSWFGWFIEGSVLPGLRSHFHCMVFFSVVDQRSWTDSLALAVKVALLNIKKTQKIFFRSRFQLPWECLSITFLLFKWRGKQACDNEVTCQGEVRKTAANLGKQLLFPGVMQRATVYVPEKCLEVIKYLFLSPSTQVMFA